MNRLNLFLTVVVAFLFMLLMVFAGQPITSEADMVQTWYDALCNPAGDQSPLYELTWRGGLSDTQLQTAINGYRERNNLKDGCKAIVNHNIIYFQWIPPELAANIECIKFVAVDVYGIQQQPEPNHVLSVRNGVHVLYDRTGTAYIFPHFIPDSPLDTADSTTPVLLYNNDGLLMGQVEITGMPLQNEQNGMVRIGIPISLSTVRAWGHYWIHIFADGVEVAPGLYADVLRPDQQASFFSATGDNLPAKTVISGVLWFAAPHADDIRLTVDAYQTLWDIRGIPVMIKVR